MLVKVAAKMMVCNCYQLPGRALRYRRFDTVVSWVRWSRSALLGKDPTQRVMGATVRDGVCEVGDFLPPFFFELKINQTHPSLLINSTQF